MKFTFAGGAREVGGSCIYLQIAGKGILLDSGIRQGSGRDPLPDFRSIQLQGGVDAIVVSHAHMDHTGSLPVISQAYPAARIYMTSMTMDLTRVLLYDSLKLMDHEEEIPHYAEPDVRAMLGRIFPLRFQQPFEILEGIRITFYPAGHIAGAACVYLESPEGTVFYSGDVSGFAQRTIEGCRLPKLRPDAMMLESTYGDRLHANRQVEEDRLVQITNRCLQEGKKVLIPSFALGRSQEVLLILRQAMISGNIPKVPVFVDGMVRDINRVYTSHPTFLRRALGRRILKGEEPFYSTEIRAVRPGERREDLVGQPGPAIFVASSGMLTGGASMAYAKVLVPREDACIIITGYQDEEAPGRMLLRLSDAAARAAQERSKLAAGEKLGAEDSAQERADEPRITLDGVSMPVRCQVEMVGLSAHSDKSELAAMVNTLTPMRVILVHGEGEAMDSLGQDLAAADVRRQIFEPRVGESVELEIRSKRKQLVRRLDQRMNRSGMPDEAGCQALWDFWLKFYPRREFTMDELYQIWSGQEAVPGQDDELLAQFSLVIGESSRFTRDQTRLYLLRPSTAEWVQEIERRQAERREREAKKEARKNVVTPQDVEKALRLILGEKAVRKFGYYPNQKQVQIFVDFPDAQGADLTEEQRLQLFEATGWTARLSPTMNFGAAGTLLSSLLPGKVGKLSYYVERRTYVLTPVGELSQEEQRQAAEAFHEATGWTLEFAGSAGAAAAASGVSLPKRGPVRFTDQQYWFTPADPEKKPLEQNLAIAAITQGFAAGQGPYKNGIRTDQHGRFLEMSFLTPAQGLAQRETIQKVCDQIGWRVHIASSSNQNMLIQMAMLLCAQYGVPITKTPSWLPKVGCMQVRSNVEELPAELTKDFLEKTGCELLLKRV